jgi:hypothetical protein
MRQVKRQEGKKKNVRKRKEALDIKGKKTMCTYLCWVKKMAMIKDDRQTEAC